MPKWGQVKNFIKMKPSESFPGGGKFALLIDEKLCGKRARAELVELQPQEGFPVHVHPKSDHLILVVQGQGRLLWQGKERNVVTGDTFVVPRGDEHSIRAGGGGLRFVVINVPPIDFHHHDFMVPVEAGSAEEYKVHEHAPHIH